MKLLIALLFFCARPALSDENVVYKNGSTHDRVPSYGHNFIATTYTLKKNQKSVGIYALSYGITDNLTVSTSPWFDYFYNMPNLFFKYGVDISGQDRISIETGYFKTFHYARDHYRQESAALRVLASHTYNDNFTLHYGFNGHYFIDDTVPFSFRLDTGYDTKFNLGVGVLFESHLTEHFGNMMEFGAQGLNYLNAYFHWGSSLFWKWSNAYLLLGFSQDNTYEKVGYYSDGSTIIALRHTFHPEIQLQFFFD